jgi:hypothetical protein
MTGTVQPTQPLREQWGIFELEPGLRLWVRVMLPFVVSHAGPPKADQVKMATIVVTEAADEFRGQPTPGSVDFQTATPIKVYETVAEIVPFEGLYLFPNQLIVSVKMRPIRARRYANHAADGDPIIQLDNEIQVQTIVQSGAPQPTGFAVSPLPAPIPASDGGR